MESRPENAVCRGSLRHTGRFALAVLAVFSVWMDIAKHVGAQGSTAPEVQLQEAINKDYTFGVTKWENALQSIKAK